MKTKMKYYQLSQILEAAKSFAITKDAMSDLEKNLRQTESIKTDIPKKDITEISYETFCEVIGCLTDCYDEVIAAILDKFQKLGYQAREEVPINPKLN